MKYNRLELMLLLHQEYNQEYQPYRNSGMYILDPTTYIFYLAGRVSHDRMIKIIRDVVTHKKEVSDPGNPLYERNQFDLFDDFTIRGADHIRFDFLYIARGREEELISYLNDGVFPDRSASFAYFEDGRILTASKSEKVFVDEADRQRTMRLEYIANWKPDPRNPFNDFEISTFADEYFNGKTKAKIKEEYKALEKKHHPDCGGDVLIFRAITRAKEFKIKELG